MEELLAQGGERICTSCDGPSLLRVIQVEQEEATGAARVEDTALLGFVTFEEFLERDSRQLKAVQALRERRVEFRSELGVEVGVRHGECGRDDDV